MKIYLLFILLLFSYTNSYANEFDFGLSYSYLRAESNQTGAPSDFLFDPTFKLHLDYTFKVTETQDFSLGVDYAMHEVDTENLSLFLGDTDFNPLNFHGRYSKWIRGGLNFIVHGGQKAFPVYTIANLTVDYLKFSPYYFGLGLALRAKNAYGTLEVEYLFKYIPEAKLGNEKWSGNAQDIKIHYNFGRKKNYSAKRPGIFAKVNYTRYKRAAIEGNYGIFFNYNFAHITSETKVDYKLDERVRKC